MTPRERDEAALLRRPHDGVPFTVYESLLPRGESERRLRDDGLCVFVHPPAFRTVLRQVTEETVRFTGADGQPRLRHVVRTPAGNLTSVVRDLGYTHWTEEYPFKTAGDYEALEAMVQDRQYVPDYEAFTARQALWGEDGFSAASLDYSPLMTIIVRLMGVEQFSIQWAENRERVLRLYEALTEDVRKQYPVVADSPASVVGYCGNVSPQVVGVERFERYILPHYDELAEALHAKGKLLYVHLDADNWPLARGIASSKVDIIEAFTPSPTCDMTVAEARQVWPDKVLWVNFPSSVHLEGPEAVEAMTRRIIGEAAPAERFLMGITEDTPPDRWAANYAAILRACATDSETD